MPTESPAENDRPESGYSPRIMNDRVVGIFEDLAKANQAQERLIGSGVDPIRTEVKRVLKPGHRGLSPAADKVHDLIHSPEFPQNETWSDTAGTVILIVEVPASPAGELEDESARVMESLERLGATETYVVEPTPGLDL